MELLKIAGLQGVLPLVAILTLIKLSYEKISYVFSLNDFDKLFIPSNKLKIYETLKYLLNIVAINFMIMFYSLAVSYYFNFSKANSKIFYTVLNYTLSLSLIMILIFILYAKIKDKVTFIKLKKIAIIDDWRIKAIFFMFHMSSFLLVIGLCYFEIFEYGMLNERAISEGEFFIISTIAIITYVYIIYNMAIWSRNDKRKQLVYKIIVKEDNKSLFVLKCKDDNTLILGDSKTYEESNNIYLYDIKQGKYSEFEKLKI